MKEKDYNKTDETVVFNPIKEDKKDEIIPEEVLEYEPPEKPHPKEEDSYDETKEKSITLIIAAIAVAIIFVAVGIWGVCTLITKEPPKETEEEIEEVIDEPSGEVTEEEEEVLEEEAFTARNIIFVTDSVEKDGTAYTVRAKLFNEKMIFEGERRISFTRDTQIIEDGSQLSVVSFVSVIESLADGVVFSGEINEETREVVTISYSSSIIKKKEEPQEIQEPQEPEEPENPEEITVETENKEAPPVEWEEESKKTVTPEETEAQ